MDGNKGLSRRMNNVRAMVVGVSRYSVPGWDQLGPARNAGLIGTTLLSMGLPAERLHLFATHDDMDSGHAATLSAYGIVFGETSWESIDDFWRGTLGQLAAPGDRLLVFWSGHGVTDDRDQRVLICTDYTRLLKNRVFDAGDFKHQLTLAPWSNFSDQLIFADACGNYPQFPVASTLNTYPERRGSTRQLAVWAVPDGEYAKEVNGYGAFSRIVAETLPSVGLATWPSQHRVVDEIAARTGDWPHHPTWIRNDGTYAKFAGFAGEPNLVSPLMKILGSIDLSGIARDAYERTARTLQLTPAVLNRVPEMIDVLSDLDDGWNDSVSFGLTLFLKRVARHPALGTQDQIRITQWVDDNALISIRGEADAVLTSERRTVLLLIDIETDPIGRLQYLTAHLRYPDLTSVPNFGERRSEIRDWAAINLRICQLIEAAKEYNQSGLEVHLLLEPPAFSLPFQQIELPDGGVLGEEYVCVVHCRRRARMIGGELLEDWSEWARAVADPIDLGQLRALPAPGNPLPARDGIYYSRERIAAAPQYWQQINRLLRLGAPYFCWPVTDSDEDPSFPDDLRILIGEAQCSADLPSRVRRERLRGCINARKIAVLWDNANFRPFAFQQLGTIT